jgi:predicted Zn-dependent protease
VILSGDAVKEFLEYYVKKANAQSIYEKTSGFLVGQKLQGEDAQGDIIQVELLPILEGSSKSAPYDADGVLLKPITLIKNGVLQTYYGANQYTSYLGVATTGHLANARFACGSMSYEAMKHEPYIELVSFSNFQMNPLTGDFGGEVRLANYYDGKQVVAVTGASISSNIEKVHSEMKLSIESMKIDNYEGPKHILFKGLEVAGN